MPKELGNRQVEDIAILKMMREYLGLTQKQAAKKAGIPLSTYQKFENGERNIRTASFTTVCKVLYAFKHNPSGFYLEVYKMWNHIRNAR